MSSITRRNPAEAADKRLGAAVQALPKVDTPPPAEPARKAPPRTAPQTTPHKDPDLSGKVVGNYLLLNIIGEGAMGRVYLGRHTRIHRHAAIKVLFTEHAQNAETLHRFVHEAAAVNTIEDEHIVQVHDFGEERLSDGTLRAYCVMEYLKGISLLDEMWKEPLAVDRAVRIAQQTAMALDRAHAAGVLHRDIKPDNIFLQQKRDGDFVKILDFGVAKVMRQIADLPKSGTIKGVLLGTPEYMAPEQALGMDVDARADIYSLGLVLYEMLTGTPPFHADTFGKLIVQIANEPPPPLPLRSRSGEMIPRALAAVVMKCLEKKPEARWATAAEFCAALDPFAETSAKHLAPSDSDWAAIQAMRPKVSRMLMMGAVLLALAAAAIWGLTRTAHADELPDTSVTQPDTAGQ